MIQKRVHQMWNKDNLSARFRPNRSLSPSATAQCWPCLTIEPSIFSVIVKTVGFLRGKAGKNFNGTIE